MSVRTSAALAILFASALVLPSLAAAQEAEQREREMPVQEKPQMRERPGGHPVDEAEAIDGTQQATEEGVPESRQSPHGRAEALEQGELRPQLLRRPQWRLGVYAYNTPTGVIVTQVVPGTPAERLGFEPGDRIVAVSGYQVGIVGGRVYYLGEELQRRVDPRGRVELLVQNVRNDQLLNMDVRLASPNFRGEPAGEIRGRGGNLESQQSGRGGRDRSESDRQRSELLPR